MSEVAYRVRVENVFEGPLDLLIHLIRKNEVDIYDIPIAMITQQFLAYVNWIKLTEINNAGDFILMAATLMQIKSRTLLPTHGHEDQEEDPRMEIVRPLLEYLQIKAAAEELEQRPRLGEDTFTRKPTKDEFPQPSVDEMLNVGLFELIDALQRILKRSSGHHQVDLSVDRISVKERMAALVDILEDSGSLTFDELVKRTTDPVKSDIIITFLAILEMVKLSLVRLTQHIQSGIIRIFYL